jgi:hypothetical protein
MGMLLRFFAMLTVALWLRRRLGWQIAWVAGALYVLMPYVAFYNPQYRLAYAETAATCILPLVFWAVDANRGRALFTLTTVAAAIFLLAQCHLPSVVIVGGLAVAYGALGGANLRAMMLSGGVVAFAVGLGIALSAFSIIPAITLLSEISASALQRFAWQDHFLFKPRGWLNPYFLLLNLCLLIPLVIGGWGMLGTWHNASFRPRVGVFCLAVCVLLPIAKPLWWVLTPLQQVQFPWRFLLPVSLFAAVLWAEKWQMSRSEKGAWIVLLLPLAALMASASFQVADKSQSDNERTIDALASSYSNAPEYMPKAAAEKGWFYFQQEGGKPSERAKGFVSPCLRHIEAAMWEVEDCSGSVVLPQFYFPGWVAMSEDKRLALDADPDSGLVRVHLPLGTSTLYLQRETLPQEILGIKISAAAWLLWCALLGYAVFSRRRRVV